jgi:hypothetical protein
VWNESRFAGWNEVGPFDALQLANIDTQPDSRLSSLRCLQPTRAAASIHFSGGVRVDGGFLALRGALPVVRVRGATRVVAIPAISEPRTGDALREIELAPGTADMMSFAFPHEWGEGVEGRFAIVASDASGEIARGQLQLRHRSLDHPLLSPTDGTQWWVEAARRDVVSAADDDRDAFDAPLEGDPVEQLSRPMRSMSRGRPSKLSAAAPRIDYEPTVCDIDGDPRTDRFMEWIAGLANVRRGVGEADLLDIVAHCYGRMDWKERWELLRALAENCYFDVLTRRNWRGREWYARPVRLLLASESAEGVVVRLTGLANWSTRRRAEEMMRRHDGEPLPVASFDTRVPPSHRWRLPSAEVANRVTRSLGLPAPRRLVPAPHLALPISSIIGGALERQPEVGELQGTWDWERAQFGQRVLSTSCEVVVEWHRREKAPDYYVVRKLGFPSWWTLSRNWGLLAAYRMAGARTHISVGSATLIRGGEGGPHLPLPIARALALGSAVGPGPIRLPDGTMAYANAARNATERAWLLDRLWGEENDTAEARREIRRILNLVAARPTRLRRASRKAGPLPSFLRRALLQCDELTGSAQLAEATVPLELVPRIRRLLKRLERDVSRLDVSR